MFALSVGKHNIHHIFNINVKFQNYFFSRYLIINYRNSFPITTGSNFASTQQHVAYVHIKSRKVKAINLVT